MGALCAKENKSQDENLRSLKIKIGDKVQQQGSLKVDRPNVKPKSSIVFEPATPDIFAQFKKVKDVDGIKEIFTYGKVLGEGGFGKVWQGFDKNDPNVVVAIKEMKREKIDVKESRRIRMQNEFDVWYKADHANIMKVFAMYQDKHAYYLVSEFMPNGSLQDYIDAGRNVRRGGITEVQVNKIALQTFMALKYMHTLNIAHRDMKPDNILMFSNDIENPSIKLTDFGFAIEFDPNAKIKDALGTTGFIPPEMMNG